jgi:hypothetical protein
MEFRARFVCEFSVCYQLLVLFSELGGTIFFTTRRKIAISGSIGYLIDRRLCNF